MALEPYFGSISSIPSEYSIPIPSGIKNLLNGYYKLPKTTKTKYTYFKKLEFANDVMFLGYGFYNDRENNRVKDNNVNYLNNGLFCAVDPNSAFILPERISRQYSTLLKTVPTNGTPIQYSEYSSLVDVTSPICYYFRDSGQNFSNGGAISVNSETVECTGYGITAVAKVNFTIAYKHKMYDEEILSGSCFIDLCALCGSCSAIKEIGYSDYVNKLQPSSNFNNVDILLPINSFGQYPSVTRFYSGNTYHIYQFSLLNYYCSIDNPSNAKPWELVALDNYSLYYSLFPRIVWANNTTRIDELLNMTPEQFNKEINEDIGENPYLEPPSAPSGGGGNYGGGGAYYPTTSLIPEGSAEANDSNSGLYTRYLVSIAEMQAIGDYFWAEDLGLQIAKTAISLLYGDPVSTVISCVSFPFALDSVGTAGTTLKWGGHDTEVSVNMISKNATQINWGTIQLSEYWGNFLDYSPHTKMQLYLPWGTGFVDIDPNDVMNAKDGEFSSSLPGIGNLSVITNIELSRGLCVHHVIANDTVIGTYSGSCGRQIPITGSDYASKQVALAGAAIGAMAAGAVSAGLGAVAYGQGSPALYGSDVSDISKRYMTKASQKLDMAQSEFGSSFKHTSKPAIACAAAVAVSPPHVSRSGSFQEGAGSLSPQKPFLVVSRPKMSLPKTYGFHYGYPSNITSSLSSISGYTEIGSIHLDGIIATSEELKELETILSGGVIL